MTPAAGPDGIREPIASPGPAPRQPVGVIIGAVAVTLLLASLGQTIVSTALPTIVAELGGLEHLTWVVTAYLLSSTVVAPIYGKLDAELAGALGASRRNIAAQE